MHTPLIQNSKLARRTLLGRTVQLPLKCTDPFFRIGLSFKHSSRPSIQTKHFQANGPLLRQGYVVLVIITTMAITDPPHGIIANFSITPCIATYPKTTLVPTDEAARRPASFGFGMPDPFNVKPAFISRNQTGSPWLPEDTFRACDRLLHRLTDWVHVSTYSPNRFGLLP